jgi:hypothetical protein
LDSVFSSANQTEGSNQETHGATVLGFTGVFFGPLAILRIFLLTQVGKNQENPRFSWLLIEG